MIFNKLKQIITNTKKSINTSNDLNNNIDITLKTIILQLYGHIDNKDDIEYLKNVYTNRHKYESFSIDKICLEINFILPILQVHYKEFGISRMSMTLINNEYTSMISSYAKSNNQDRMVILIYIRLLLDFLKDHIIFKNINYMFELRNNLHMVADKDIFKRYFTISDISSLSTNKKVLLNILLHYDFYSLESLEYIINNNILVNMYDGCIKLIDPYLDKFIDSYEKIDIEKYLYSSFNNLAKLSTLFKNKNFMSKIKIYKPYYKKYLKVLTKTNFNNEKSLNKTLEYNYTYKISNTFVLDEINDITNPSAKDIKILKFIKTF